MAEYETITLDATPGGVAIVTLNRPEKHNAFNAIVIRELSDAFENLRPETRLRMVVLRGNGKSFSAGADLDWMKAAAQYTVKENEDDALELAEMLRRLHDLPQLTVALVQGAAMGGGAGLVAACDVAVAMRTATFRFSEVRLGLTPATISPYVIEAIGPRRAKALFMTGESFDAAHAERIGLVQYVVEDGDGMADIEEHLSALMFETAPGAVADAKRLVHDVTGVEINRALSQETAKRIAARRASEEGREGLSAFLEKRRPDWAG
ncbi:MAG: enoyl-CoA hydratase-related protein [Pseudomonadota bacterium]